MKLNDIYQYLNQNYPFCNASSFDQGKLGMQLGSYHSDVTTVLLTLDVTDSVIDEAINCHAQLIITHHPFIFYPLLVIDYDLPQGQMIKKLIENKIMVLSMHTNFDVAAGGMNDILAAKLGMKDVVSVPAEIGADVFVRTGYIEPQTLANFAKVVKEVFNEQSVKIVGNSEKLIHKIGIVGGSGGSELMKVYRAGCDAYVTGEIRHNTALDAKALGLGLIEVSHSVERHFKENLLIKMQNELPTLEVHLAKTDTCPFMVI